MSPVSDIAVQNRFDTRALWDYLSRHLAGFALPAQLSQFSGGQSNPTFLIRTPGRRFVLRKKPAGALLSTAHLIEREFRALRALEPTGFPVPAARLWCEDVSIIGTAFYVMDYYDGRLFTDPSLPGLTVTERRRLFDAAIGTLAELHSIQPEAVGLADFGKPQQYLTRQIQRWCTQYRQTQTGEIDAMEQLLTWLPQNLPADASVAVVHGDYRLGNLLFAPAEPRVGAVLDWELATLGHPLTDLAHFCLTYHTPRGMPHFDGLAGLDLQHAGLPSEADLIERYCRATRRAGIADWPFFLALAFFRIAAICQGVFYRGLGGNAADTAAVSFGELAKRMAELGWAVVARHTTAMASTIV